MAKKPDPRHRQSSRQPVVINLDPVPDKPEKPEPATVEAKPAPASTPKVKPAAEEPKTDKAAEARPDGETRKSEKTAKPETPKQPATAKRSGVSLVAALVGGVVALAGAAGLQWAGILPAPGSGSAASEEEITQLSGRIGQLEQFAAGVPAAVQEVVDQAVATGPAAGSESSEAVATLQGQLAEISDKVAALQSSVSSGEAGDAAAVSQIASRVDDLEQKISAIPSSDGATADLGPLEDRIAKLESGAESTGSQISSALPAIEALDSRVAAIESQLETLSTRVESQSGQPSIARAIAAAALKSAIDRGDPFMSELETFAAVATSDGTAGSDIEALRNLAASGVPTVSAIQKSLVETADAIISATDGVPSDAGITDRLMASARSLIKARPVGEVEGETPAAIVARMETALNNGNLAKALAEAETLPDPSRQAAYGLIQSIKARLTADSIIAQTVSGAITPASGEGEQGETK